MSALKGTQDLRAPEEGRVRYRKEDKGQGHGQETRDKTKGLGLRTMKIAKERSKKKGQGLPDKGQGTCDKGQETRNKNKEIGDIYGTIGHILDKYNRGKMWDKDNWVHIWDKDSRRRMYVEQGKPRT